MKQKTVRLMIHPFTIMKINCYQQIKKYIFQEKITRERSIDE